ncbi:hypothetical protein CDD83_7200 [Cordyceps sp. RAO-2017]|nr:hypothetical protein CDD83_7200 [Cordyceps sp. RAO-2017]
MKTTLAGCLLLSGLVHGQSDSGSAAPACVTECTQVLSRHSASSGAMRALCDDTASQRALFQCLVDSCRSRSYGPALGHVVSACSRLGSDISPLHPIESWV